MKIESLIIGILIVSGLVLGSYSFISSLSVSYDQEVDSSYLSSYNKTEDISQDIEDRYTQLQGESLNPANFFAAGGIIWDAVKLVIVTPWTIITDMISYMSEALPIPSWFIGLITALIVTSILFALIAAIWKYKI